MKIPTHLWQFSRPIRRMGNFLYLRMMLKFPKKFTVESISQFGRNKNNLPSLGGENKFSLLSGQLNHWKVVGRGTGKFSTRDVVQLQFKVVNLVALRIDLEWNYKQEVEVVLVEPILQLVRYKLYRTCTNTLRPHYFKRFQVHCGFKFVTRILGTVFPIHLRYVPPPCDLLLNLRGVPVPARYALYVPNFLTLQSSREVGSVASATVNASDMTIER